MTNNDFTYCTGTQSDKCRQCKRRASVNRTPDMVYWIDPAIFNGQCENFLPKK